MANNDYQRVFNTSSSLAIYWFCAKAIKSIDDFVYGYPWPEKSNLKFHLATIITTKLLNQREYEPKNVESLLKLEQQIFNQTIDEALTELVKLTRTYASSQLQAKSIDTISKSRDFVNYLLKNVKLHSRQNEKNE